MENKTTTELLDLLKKLVDEKGTLLDGWDEAWEELKMREPFYDIYGDEGILERMDSLEVDIKKLKRHKHDPLSGDVTIRI